MTDMTRLALIGCSATKLATPARADELYQGNLFKKALVYAKRNADEVRILSAKHGVVKLDTVLEPYDLTLSRMTYNERKAWMMLCRVHLEQQGFKHENTFIVFLCGQTYVQGIQGRYRYAWYRHTAPLDGKGIGDQLGWLTRQNATDAASRPLFSARV
jgi:hypothetical protein